MSRKEKMLEEAEAYAAGLYADEPVSFSTEEDRCVTMNDFCAGWRAADRCPQWIPVNKRLPEPNIYKEGKTFPLVLVCLTDGCVDTDAYDTDTKTWCKYDGEVEYWMSLPTPPQRKEAKND